jgi:thiol-disulfide isomerase/thioredoxin
MKPVVDGLKQQYEGKVEFRLYNVEKDQEGIALANSMGVTAVPTFVFVNSNGIQAGTQVGSMSKDQLQAQLDALQ